MRILWLRSDENPWKSGSSWDQFHDSGFELKEAFSVEEARSALRFLPSAFVCTHEVPGALEFLAELRGRSSIPTVLVSSTWGKDDFRVHSATPGGAHRYAKAPMPAEGFVDMLCTLLKISREELKSGPRQNVDASVASSEGAEFIPVVAPAPQAQSSEDVEALRKYLQLREQELVTLQARFEETQADYKRVQDESESRFKDVRAFQLRVEDEEQKVRNLEERLKESERQTLIEKENAEVFSKSETEKRKEIERELRDTKERYEALKTRVRRDLRKIRVRERELEAKLELLRTDSERMVEARDAKVLELQRKIDALEFDIDQLQDSRYHALTHAERYLAKLARVSRTLHVALAMIDQDEPKSSVPDDETLFGGAAEGLESVKDEAPAPAPQAVAPKKAKEVTVAAPTAPLKNQPAHHASASAPTMSVALQSPATATMAQSDESLFQSMGESMDNSDLSAAVSEPEASAPPAEAAMEFNLDNLANDGEPTQMVVRPVAEEGSQEESSDMDAVG